MKNLRIKLKILVSMFFGLTILTLSGCASNASQKSAGETYNQSTIATTRQLMLGITGPTSDVIFQLGMQEPATDAEWEKVIASAMSLAESANLLMAPPRLVDREKWIDYSRDLISAAKLAATAAEDRNLDGVMQSNGPIYQTCVGCHQQYAPTR